MEFDAIEKLFSSLSAIKKKYPMITSYQKYLSQLSDDDKKGEIETFKKFLIQNDHINEKIFDEPYYKGYRRVSPLFMRKIVELCGDSLAESFWNQLYEIEKQLFPEGKPKKIEKSETLESKTENALAAFQNNPIFADVIGQVKTAVEGMGDTGDVNTILASPEFKKMVNNIKSGLNTGKYKLSDLTGTINAVIGSVQDELDPETRETLQTVSKTMAAVERGETPDISKVMELVGNLKIN